MGFYARLLSQGHKYEYVIIISAHYNFIGGWRKAEKGVEPMADKERQVNAEIEIPLEQNYFLME